MPVAPHGAFWRSLTAAKYASQHIKSTRSIILTNGVIGLRPQKGWVVAAGICGAVEALTRALAIELGARQGQFGLRRVRSHRAVGKHAGVSAECAL
jgi:hypothetical protein